MNNQDKIAQYIRKLQDKYLDTILDQIKDLIKNNPNKTIIDCHNLDIDKFNEILNEENQLEDEYFKPLEDGFRILIASSTFFDKIKESIPKTIKELTIPRECLTDLSFLKTLPNLETIILSDNSFFSQEELDYIRKNTTIKNIEVHSPNREKMQSTKLQINYNKAQEENTSSLVITVPSYDELTDAIILYNKILPSIDKKHKITFLSDANPNSKIVISDKGVISFKKVPMPIAAKFYASTKKDFEYTSGKYYIYDLVDKDIYYLNSINREIPLQVNSPESNDFFELDEYENMYEAVLYYEEIIESSNLSPIEKITYAYDILKTWKYQENNFEKRRARSIPSIITYGTIVCVGYSMLLQKIINGLGGHVSSFSTIIINDEEYEYHERDIIRLDDDKYNYHGLYVLDPTWDSDKNLAFIREEQSGEYQLADRDRLTPTDTIIEEYDSLTLYRFFLIPLSEYEEKFPNECPNDTIYKYLTKDVTPLVLESRRLRDTSKKTFDTNQLIHNKLFSPSEGPLTVKSYIEAEKPSLESFEEILRNVRKAEGYNDEEAETAARKIVELHQLIESQNKNTQNVFFKSSQTK